ncbi:MAG: SH3 domain-containing protein, partial [Clostridiales bacterium]|nr:SH3 domain-containing protein [Clostridiales bacterium]MDY5513650.1 SH3 domain-containing protein [Candidatus Ventricola sp.]
DGSWALLGIHRYIEAAGAAGTEDNVNVLYQAVVSTQSGALNVRDAPDGGRIGSLPKGTTVDVLAEPAQGWTFVRSGSLMGYVSSAYLTRAESKEEGNVISVSPNVTIIDDEGNSFKPVGGWRVLIGGVD